MSRKNKTKEPILPKVKILADFFNHGLKLTRHEVFLYFVERLN